ncbi:MAG: two-component system sensor histidine kinase KdbD [Candidatus Rokuibacteriota bacterium]|nr:MAG: two-component system sensor histidine kinase KdbD [Candidatus Rokubacteria bacterium]
MPDRRPDPDELLVRVREQEARRTRGKLKVFFGAAAGVGKTYAMLEAARAQRAAGVDVVAGVVETHHRAETEALLAGVEMLPRRRVEYRGSTLEEFDLDAALARRPALLLVDELAHTNAPESRHPKRYQDVLELLDAGINVYTTLNVQHLESLNDLVAKITGVVVRETVPDSVLDEADDVELVDLPAEDLRRRLKEGKVYVPEQAAEAAEHFFREGNLIALRELALRHTAERVDAKMQRYRREHAIDTVWPVTEHVMVCIGPSPAGARLVRAGHRLAAQLAAPWVVAYVETAAQRSLGAEDRARVAQTLRLAESLGAETVTLTGTRMSDEILAYARSRNVSKLVIGKPTRGFWPRLFLGSIVDTLVRGSGEIDIYVISGDGTPTPTPRTRTRPRAGRPLPYAAAIATVLSSTLLAWLMFPRFELSNIVMVYLLGVVVVAMRFGRAASVLASLLSVAAFDFFFVPPYFTFAVSDSQYLVTFLVMFVVALVISGLTVRTRDQAEAARTQERRTAALFSLSRELAAAREIAPLLEAAVRHLIEVFGGRIVILLPDATGRLEQRAGQLAPFNMDARDLAVAQWAFEHRAAAGSGTDNVPGAQMRFEPLSSSRGVVGVVGMRPAEPHAFDAPEQEHLLETFVSQVAVAVDRALLADEAQAAQVRMEAERVRNALLSAVSHDLRTPLTAITGAASAALEDEARIDAVTRRELLESIRDEAERLNRLVNNLLDVTRLESGSLRLRREWIPVEELVGVALARLAAPLRERKVTTRLPEDLPPVHVDGLLVEQVFINLIENATKHTPAGQPIDVEARREGDEVVVEVADRGPGLPAGQEQKIFDKFYGVGAGGGAGLGLTICRAIVEAHGGRIGGQPRPGGGALFRFSLPAGEPPRPPESPGG